MGDIYTKASGTALKRETTIISIHDLGDLKIKRSHLAAIRAERVDSIDAEIAEIDKLIAEADKLGIVSRLTDAVEQVATKVGLW